MASNVYRFKYITHLNLLISCTNLYKLLISDYNWLQLIISFYQHKHLLDQQCWSSKCCIQQKWKATTLFMSLFSQYGPHVQQCILHSFFQLFWIIFCVCFEGWQHKSHVILQKSIAYIIRFTLIRASTWETTRFGLHLVK